MPKQIVWTSVVASFFIAVSTISLLTDAKDIALVMSLNGIAFAVLALKDN